jgi:hypothetical protein
MRTTKSALRTPCKQAICGDVETAPKSSAMTGSWRSVTTAARAAARNCSKPEISELMKTFMAVQYL